MKNFNILAICVVMLVMLAFAYYWEAEMAFEKENPIKFYEITDKTCRWPSGHPHESNFYFCGRTPMEKFPYCKLHVLYAFQAKNEKEEDKITEEDAPLFIEKKIKSA